MSFIWPTMLLALGLIPLFGAGYALAQRRRRRIAALHGSLGFAQAATGRPLGRRRHLPPALFLAGLSLLLCGLARPQAVIGLPRLEGTVILAIDVSRSMAAADAEPTRLEVARAAARDFVGRQPASVLIGVVAFSDSGLAVQVPTSDRTAILAAIDRLRPELGTSLGQGMGTALNAIAISMGAAPAASGATSGAASPDLAAEPDPASAPDPVTPAVMILFSDGENNGDPDPLEVAATAARRQVRISTVGIGSPAGASLEIDGFTVHTQLDEATLREIARISAGEYYAATSQQDLPAINDQLETQLVTRDEASEVTALFAGGGLLLLLIGAVLSLIWLSRAP